MIYKGQRMPTLSLFTKLNGQNLSIKRSIGTLHYIPHPVYQNELGILDQIGYILIRQDTLENIWILDETASAQSNDDNMVTLMKLTKT